jgi:hypothetical protein
MAANHVYVFAKSAPSPVTFLSEIRSAVEKGGKTISTMQVKMFKAQNAEKTVRLPGDVQASCWLLNFETGWYDWIRYPDYIALHSKRYPYRRRVSCPRNYS